MSTSTAAPPDIEAGAAPPPVPTSGTSVRVNNRRRQRRRRRPKPSVGASSETTTDGSFRFSDTEDDSRSMHSQFGGVSHDECSFSTETEGISVISGTHRHGSRRRGSVTVSEDGVGEEKEKEVDLESGELELELKVHRKRERRRECRICHLSSSVIGGRNSGDRKIIELGCCCKGDLGSAHRECADTWFKIKGNTICEICSSSAVNIAGEQPSDANNAAVTSVATSSAPPVLPEARSSWHGRRVMNFLLACMIFAFIISWLFHFKILGH